MRGLLFGKGPSFNPGLVDQLRPDWVACVNESVLHVPGPRWLVYCDRPMGERLSALQDTDAFKLAGVYCPDRDKDLWHRPVCFRTLRRRMDTSPVTRQRAMCGSWCYQEGFSSTNALWLLWMLGCTCVHLSGVGDPDGYHENFSGAPAVKDEGRAAVYELDCLADVKGVELVYGCQ